MPGMKRKSLGGPLEPYEALGRAVRARRAELDLTQEELEGRSGLDRTYISDIERGRRNPTVQVIWVLANGLDLTPDALIERSRRLIEEVSR